jgi:hypothetical protein
MGAGSTALVLLSLVISGFLFNLIFYPLRYFSSKAEGQKLFFMAAGAGLIIGALVFGVTGLIKSPGDFVGSPVSNIASIIDRAIPVPFACRLLLTILVAVTSAFSLNVAVWFFYGQRGRSTTKRVYNKLTDQFGNPLSQLLRRAADRQKLVLLTLKSRKIYCGRILEVPPNIESNDACVEVLPSFSGYRNKDTLRMGEEKTDYPVIALWEARQYEYSVRETLAFFEEKIASFGDVGSMREIIAERKKLQSAIDEAQAVIARFGAVSSIDIGDWIKVIPIKEIESASFYDVDAYKAWFSSSGEPQASDKSPDTFDYDEESD